MKTKSLFITTFLLLFIFQSVNAEELTDQAGFKFNKPKKVERLVIVFPQSFGLAYILGLGDNIVGMPLHKIGLEKQSDSIFMRTVAPNIETAVDIGNPGRCKSINRLHRKNKRMGKKSPELIIINAKPKSAASTFELDESLANFDFEDIELNWTE